jgi:hypothetical protein
MIETIAKYGISHQRSPTVMGFARPGLANAQKASLALLPGY